MMWLLKGVMMKLKPCPFCGSDEVEITSEIIYTERFLIQCQNCCSQGPEERKKEIAIEKWNERVEL